MPHHIPKLYSTQLQTLMSTAGRKGKETILAEITTKDSLRHNSGTASTFDNTNF